MGASQSIAECRCFLDSLSRDTEHNLARPSADITAPGTPGVKVSSMVGQASRALSKRGSAAQFAEGGTDRTGDLGINGSYGLHRFRRIRKP